MTAKLTTFTDFFCGLGGFGVALSRRGLKCVLACDADPLARATYAVNFGHMPVGDIRKVRNQDVPPHDVLCMGFPCQPHSVGGRRLGSDDPDGALCFETVRLIGSGRPAVVLAENVTGFSNSKGGEDFKQFQARLESLGYKFHNAVLDSLQFGVPQSRPRLFMVAIRRDCLAAPFAFPAGEEPYTPLRDFLEPEDKTPRRQIVPGTEVRWRSEEALAMTGVDQGPILIGEFGCGSQGSRIYSDMGSSVTLMRSPGKTGFYPVNGRPQGLTPSECRKLMGFPAAYRLLAAPADACGQFGNAVVVPVIAAMLERVFEAVGHSR